MQGGHGSEKNIAYYQPAVGDRVIVDPVPNRADCGDDAAIPAVFPLFQYGLHRQAYFHFLKPPNVFYQG